MPNFSLLMARELSILTISENSASKVSTKQP